MHWSCLSYTRERAQVPHTFVSVCYPTYSYVIHMHMCVIRIYSYVTRMYLYVSVWNSYVPWGVLVTIVQVEVPTPAAHSQSVNWQTHVHARGCIFILVTKITCNNCSSRHFNFTVAFAFIFIHFKLIRKLKKQRDDWVKIIVTDDQEFCVETTLLCTDTLYILLPFGTILYHLDKLISAV